MSHFEIEMPGHLYRNWPPGKEIELADCCFTPGENVREFIVHTEIEAEDEENALKAGREICLIATHLLEFCFRESVYLDEKRDRIHRKGSEVTTGRLTFTAGATFVKDSPPTDEQLKAVEKAQNTLISEQDREKKELLMRAIYWQAIGRREAKSLIDRFIKFWISLEVLVEGEGNSVVRKIREPLSNLYPSCNEQKISEVVGRIYGIRAEIVHFGITEPENVKEKLNQLEAIVNDLLGQRLGLNFHAYAEQYLN